MSRKSLIVAFLVTFGSLLAANRFLFKESWPSALRGGLFIAVASIATTALVIRNKR
ncbi:MAG TPA: hypothetical protein GX528_00790 [Firmicutes bacterium]|nr:hypothetical protein [Bacillota bacterium]